MNNQYRTQQHTKERGVALLTFVLFFLFVSAVLVIGIARSTYQSLAEARVLEDSKRSFYAAEAGLEDAIYRHRDALSYSSTESFTIDGTSVAITRTPVLDAYRLVARATSSRAVRRSEAVIVIGDGASFNFGLQSGNGGVFMENNSSILGNVFSNGVVRGANNNIVYGDIISAGPSGEADGVHATGSVWAHRIESSLVDKNAYYQTIVGTIVGGISYPGSPDQATATLPISDDQIDIWKADAEAGGVVASTSPGCSSGTYVIDNDTTIGPLKIECDVLIERNSTDVYLQGALWVVGSIDIKNEPNIRVDAAAANKSIAVIADNPSDRTVDSKIVVQNNAVFSGSGTNSYILLISQNNSTESGGSEVAINIKNNATGALLLYAAHGEVLVENGTGLKSITGYYVHTKNNTQIIYESGLISLLFTAGPGGGYTIDSWREI